MHHLVIRDGVDAAADAKMSFAFIVDLLTGSGEKRRAQPKASATVVLKASLTPAAHRNEKAVGIVK